MCIVRPDGPPQLCKTDEIGEIIINSRAGGTMYYGLPGLTKNTFEVWKEKWDDNLHEQIQCTLGKLVHFLFAWLSFSSVCHCAQVIPVNANGVPIGEIPFVRSGLLGFVGPVSATLSLMRKQSHLTCSMMTLLCVWPPTGESDLCGWENRGSAAGERAETQRWRPGGHCSRRGAS